jgi:hypothetical protein
LKNQLELEVNLYEEKTYQLNEEHKKESIIFQTLRTELSNSFKEEIYIKDLSELDKVSVYCNLIQALWNLFFIKKELIHQGIIFF